MKKLFRSFTFCFIVMSLLTIFSHYIGQDPKGIVLIGLNPILAQFSNNKDLLNFITSGPKVNCGNLSGSISVYWYYAHFISFMLIGAILDLFRFTIRKYRNFGAKAI